VKNIQIPNRIKMKKYDTPKDSNILGNAPKIAILHPWMDSIGGAEKVALIMARRLSADIYTTCINKQAIVKMGFSDVIPRIFSIGDVINSYPLRQDMCFLRFRFLRLSGYDLYIINSDWAVSATMKNHPAIFYANNAPCRELFNVYERNQRKDTGKDLLNQVSHRYTISQIIWANINRHYFMKYMDKCKEILTNSKYVKKEFEKHFKKDICVIYPPVDTKKFYYKKPQGFWLNISRLTSYKRVDLIVKAFQKMPHEKLIMIGWGEKSKSYDKYKAYLMKIKTSNVRVIEPVNPEKLKEYYATCKGLIAIAIKEDFGLTAVEAMASGKPVIATNEGGYRETIINGKTGYLIDADIDSITAAVKKISTNMSKNPSKYKTACIIQAKNFSEDKFIHSITQHTAKYSRSKLHE
jgi:glycosyltransferase involved in cell wall biosynthesis